MLPSFLLLSVLALLAPGLDATPALETTAGEGDAGGLSPPPPVKGMGIPPNFTPELIKDLVNGALNHPHHGNHRGPQQQPLPTGGQTVPPPPSDGKVDPPPESKPAPPVDHHPTH